MTNADQFEQLFGFKASELWALSEDRFLKWLTSEAPELFIKVNLKLKPMINSETLRLLYMEDEK